MKTLSFGKIWLLLFGMVAMLASCNKTDEASEAEVESFVEETVFRIQESCNMGRFGCYELVFPITLTYPDGSVSEDINSYEELAAAVKAWRQDNPRVRIRPVITLPFSVLNEEGELITLETREEVMRLRMECKRDFFENHGPMGHNGRGKFCFRLQYPISIEYPDGTVESYASRQELHMALRTWKKDNPGIDVRPALVFPLSVIMEDGTVVTVNSKEELKQLKEDCK